MSVLFGVTGLLGSVGVLAAGVLRTASRVLRRCWWLLVPPLKAPVLRVPPSMFSIFWVSLVALVSPVISRLIGKRIPDVVFLLILGC